MGFQLCRDLDFKLGLLLTSPLGRQLLTLRSLAPLEVGPLAPVLSTFLFYCEEWYRVLQLEYQNHDGRVEEFLPSLYFSFLVLCSLYPPTFHPYEERESGGIEKRAAVVTEDSSSTPWLVLEMTEIF